MNAVLSFPCNKQSEVYSRSSAYHNPIKELEAEGQEILIRCEENLKIYASNAGYMIELSLPGLMRDDLVIETVGQYLTVYLERYREKSLSKLQDNYSSLIGAFLLPANVSRNRMVTRFQKGILKIKFLKKSSCLQLNRVEEINEKVYNGLQRAMKIFRGFQE
jgi:HSP20 family molecular chaperone IbpA